MAREIIALTAGSRSSKSLASSSRPESRSRPRVSWVRSFEPIDMPSKCSRNCSARMALLGTSHIMITLRPSLPPAEARFRPLLGEHVDHLLGLAEGAHERHHDLDVVQAHVAAHAHQRLALHREGLAEGLADVARRAAKAEHRVFFLGLVARAADQLPVLVALEVGQAHDHRLRPERGGDRGDALGQLVDVEGARRGVAAGHALDRLLQVGVDVRIVEDRLRVHADVVVDDELEPRQADAGVRHLREVEGELRVADVHHDLHRRVRQLDRAARR